MVAADKLWARGGSHATVPSASAKAVIARTHLTMHSQARDFLHMVSMLKASPMDVMIFFTSSKDFCVIVVGSKSRISWMKVVGVPMDFLQDVQMVGA